MNNNFPIPISTEADLDFYKNYLAEEFETPLPKTFAERLKAYIDSFVKIDCVLGGRLEAKFGKLIEVGEDFILIKHPQSNQKMLLHTSCVKFVTISKENHIYNNFTIYKK